MDRPNELPPQVAQIVEQFVQAMGGEHTAPLRDWLFAVGSMAAVLMKTAGLDEAQAREAMQYVASTAYHVYTNLPSEELTVQ
jgi:hypothetical protein